MEPALNSYLTVIVNRAGSFGSDQLPQSSVYYTCSRGIILWLREGMKRVEVAVKKNGFHGTRLGN